jgi:outer membrane protein assembly factor BamB
VEITVSCPRCGSQYHLKPEMRGKRMRCPNAICREVFEVREKAEGPTETPTDDDGKNSRRTPPRPDGNHGTGSVGDMVPLLSVETAAEPESAPAQPVWQQAPPPVRRTPPASEPAPAAPVIAESVPLLPAEPAAPEPAWQQAPPPVRRTPAPPKEPEAPQEPPPAPPVAPMAEVRSWQEGPPPVRQPADSPPELPAGRNSRRSKKETMPAPERRAPDAPKDMPPGTWEPPPVRQPPKETPPAPGEAITTPDLLSAPSPPVESESEPAPVPPGRKAVRGMLALGALLIAAIVAALWYTGVVSTETEEIAAAKAKEAYERGAYPEAARIYQKLRTDFPDSANVRDYEFWEDFSRARAQVKALDEDADSGLELLRGFTQKYQKHPLFPQYEADLWEAFGQLIDGKLLPPKLPDVTPENVDAMEKLLEKIRQVLAEVDQYAPRGSDGNKVKSSAREKRLAEFQAAINRAKELRKFLAWLETLEPTLENLKRAEDLARKLGFANELRVQAWINRVRQSNLDVWRPGGTTHVPQTREDGTRTLLITPRLDRGPTPAVPGVVLALARGVLYALAATDGEVLWADRVGIDSATLPVRLPKDEGHPRELVLVLSTDTNLLTARDALTGTAQWQYPLDKPCLGRPVVVNRKAYLATVDGWVHEIETVKGQLLGRFQLGLPLTGTGARQEGTSLVYFPADAGFVYVLDVESHKCVGVLQTGHPSGSLRGEPILVSDDRPANVVAPRFLILGQSDGLDAMKLRAYRLPIEKITRAAPLQPEPRIRGWSWFPPYCDGEKVVLATDAGVLGLFGINQFHNQDAPLFPLLPNEQRLDGDERQSGRAQVVHATENDFWVLAQGQLQHYRLGLAADKGLGLAPVWQRPLALGSPLHAAQASEDTSLLFVVTQSIDGRACLASAVEAPTGKIRWQRQLGLSDPDEALRVGSRVVVPDHGAGLFVFDPKDKTPPQTRTPAAPAGALAAFLPGDDGDSAFALLVPAPGQLALRRHGFGKKPADVQSKDFTGTLGGTAALGTGCLVLPMADGMLLRLALTPNARPDVGPHWRAAHADTGALGHVAALGGTEFLVSDGSRGLRRLNWPGTVWERKGEAQLEDRIVAAPLVLPGDGMGPVHVCVADAAGNLVLLDGTKLKELRRWALGGKITAGPFALGKRIGCVVDRVRLVCIDPAQAEPAWQRVIEKGTGIVGNPQEVGGSLIVADQSGRFTALDPDKGTPRGPGYELQASVAPAAAPVAFGTDRIFAPLTDGTVLLLMVKQLTEAKKAP